MKTFTDDWLYVYIEYEKQEAHVHGLQPPNHLELKKKEKKKIVTKQIQKKMYICFYCFITWISFPEISLPPPPTFSKNLNLRLVLPCIEYIFHLCCWNVTIVT